MPDRADGFSARFTRLVKLSRGTYRYSITVDDGARLWVDGQLLIDARYWVVHAGQSTLRVIDQAANGGAWVSLGAYTFDGSGDEYVSLADVTFESSPNRRIAWDAVRWEPR